MEEDTELEEGEAKEPCDPDKDFSYLDQKLQLLLGDQQKEFQGCTLSTEKLGSKFGGYGTFLPTQARGPSVLANPLPPPHSVEPMSVLTEGSVESVKHMAGVADKPMHAQSYGEPPTQKVLKKKNGVSNDPIVSKKLTIRLTVGKGGEKETQPKVIQNGLSFDHLSSASLGNDDKHNLSDAEFSPEPSPRSMIKIMTSYHTPRDLLSPLPPSFLESLDRKEKAPITLKVNKPAKAPLNTCTPGGKVDPDRGNERKVKADEKEKEKQAAIELRKVSEVVVDGGKRARRDSDVEKKIQNEPVLKGPVKLVRNDVSKGEQQEVSIDKVLEGPSKEDAESGKELMPKSLGGKQTDLKAELAGIASKEKEGSDVKASRKPSVVQDKDSKETTQAKEIIKQQGRKNPEAAKVGTSEKDSSDKIGSLTDGWKQEKHESKEILVFKGNEVLKEVKKENRKKDSVSDFTAGDVHKETIKATAKGERTTKNEPINMASQKDVIKDQKRSKTARDTKVGKKERHKEQGPVLEAAPKAEYEKVQGRVDTAAPAPIVTDPVVMPTQLVLDNWVQCDKCETWRLLLPGIDTPDSSAKWNCKMMVWLPGMNNCKFTEEETTAAVYSYLGLQNPKLVPTTGAHAEMPPLPPVVEPFLKKSAIPADTKRGSRITTDKKRPVGSVPAGGVKTAGSKGADGTVSSKSLNDAALDANADEIAYARILADKNKLKEKEKKKRQRTSEGDVTPRKKSVGEEKHIPGSGVKHPGGLNAGMVQGEKDTEQNRVARERDETEAQPLPSIPAKRKKQMEIAAEGNETKSLKKSKGNKVHNNDASLDEDIKVGERVSSQRGKAGSNVINANDVHHSRQTDIDTHNIASVLKDSRSSPEVYKSGESEKGLDQKENGRATNIEKSKLELNKVLDRRKNSKEDENKSEQRAVKRPKQDVHGHPRLESNRHVNRTMLPSEQEPEILEVTASPAPAAPPNVIGSKNEVFKKESLNYSTLSKVCSSPESSRTGSKAHGSSPIESTVSSSPVRFRKGEREQSRNQQGGPENLSLPNEGVLQQHSWSASPKDGEDASHQFSWDEGEFHHAGAWHGANVSRKHDHSSGAHDEEWNWDEHRGANPGFAYDSHQDHSGQRPDCNWDQDELDGQYERRVNQNSHYDGDHNQGVRDPWPNERPDVQEDPYSREHHTRDDWGRPSSRESRLDKTGGGSWHDEQQLEQGEEVPTKDETLPATSEHGARDDRFVSKGTSWEGERAAPVSRKENDSATVHSLDIPVPGKRLSATASARVKEDTGKVLKREGQTSILSKALVNIGRDGEGVTGSPVKREHSHVHNPAFSVAKKEARALKHSADHLKNEPGLEVESTNLYLQAALKFLQAAALVENDNTDINRAGETQSMVVYNDTATLCKYCAGQYERRSDMAAAALAYTCAAVALGRRMLCKNVSFARDCNELLTAAQQASAPPVTSNGPLLRPPLPSRSADKPGSSLPMVRDTGIGESPSSSSASDVDNLNNQSLVPSDKGTVTQVGRIGMASPQTMPGAVAPSSHSMVPSHLRSSFIRVLKDASDMSNLLEAWQKAATVTAKAEATCDQKGMLAVKKVGELGGFGDIETVVHLVRVAMDTIGH